MQIVNLTSHDRSSLTRQEFFCALALVALAQSPISGTDSTISIERLSTSLADLPLPSLSVPRSPEPYSAPSETWDARLGQNGDDGNPEAVGYSVNGNQEGGVDGEGERGYWKRLENVEVSLISEKEGWFLQKYRVESDVSHLV